MVTNATWWFGGYGTLKENGHAAIRKSLLRKETAGKKNIGPVDVPQKLKKIKYIQLAHVGVLLKLKGGKICQQPDIHHENKCLFWIFLMQWKVSLSYL